MLYTDASRLEQRMVDPNQPDLTQVPYAKLSSIVHFAIQPEQVSLPFKP